MNKSFFLIFVSAVVLTGCASNSATKVHLISRDGLDVSAIQEGHITVFIKDAKISEKYCMAPSPDAVLDSSSSISLPRLNPVSALTSAATALPSGNAEQGGASRGGVSMGRTANDMNLGGRSPSVLIVREILYRFCELSLNADLSKDEQVQLWRQIVPSLAGAALGAPVPPPATQ